MSDLVEHFLAGYTGNTARAYRRDLVDFQTFLAEQAIDLLAAGRADVNAYLRSLEARELSASTRARRLAAVSGLYTYAVAEGILERNPVAHVKRPTVSQDSQTAGLDQVEAIAILGAARADDARTYALVTLLLHTGARLGEALGLQVEDVTVDGGLRVVRLHGKGGKIRVIPAPAPVAAALDALIGARTTGPVFVTRTGGTWAPSQAFRKVQQLAKLAGIAEPERITPHSLRHTSITAALAAGATIHDAQDFAGHADPRTTQRYNRARHNLINSPAHKLADYFGEVA